MAIGESKNFTGVEFLKYGRKLILHEISHLLGTTDTYIDGEGSELPGTKNQQNLMYKGNGVNLTQEQIVKEVAATVVGAIGEIFKSNTGYKPPQSSADKEATQTQLTNFVEEHGSISKKI